ncbi:TetR/AcrR family transcriptional regulator [Maricurvus nonylphenolicus]|uniref:TetR/AcrR family transcriptional regulator n=1 Tax=Maricurvus nonylphenolicus TaxID=1008307 RepID=UPI0036F320CC
MAKASSYHHGDLKEALISAAADLIAEHGQANFSLRKVAQQVGVSQTALYRHFSDKDELLAAVAERGFLELSRLSHEAFDQYDDVVERNIEVGMAYLNFAADNPNTYRLMFDSSMADNERYTALADARRLAFKCPARNTLDLQKLRDPNHEQTQRQKQSAKIFSQAIIHGIASLMIEGMIHSEGDRETVLRNMLEDTLFT